MVSCGNPLKTLLVAIVLVALVESGSASETLASCCEKVTTQEIKDPILGYLVQTNSIRPCVDAVIFQTEKGLFCVYPRARWIGRKIRAFEKAKRQATSSPLVSPSRVSLLSIITSTASPSSPPHPRCLLEKTCQIKMSRSASFLPPADMNMDQIFSGR